MRQFFVYGFRVREEFDAKSARSYDNEKRRVESWLSDYMSFRQDTNGRAVFLSVDSRHIPWNPPIDYFLFIEVESEKMPPILEKYNLKLR